MSEAENVQNIQNPETQTKRRSGRKKQETCSKGHPLRGHNLLTRKSKKKGKYEIRECRLCANDRARQRRAEKSPKPATKKRLAEERRQRELQPPLGPNGKSLLNTVALTPEERKFIESGSPLPEVPPDPAIVEEQLREAFPIAAEKEPEPVIEPESFLPVQSFDHPSEQDFGIGGIPKPAAAAAPPAPPPPAPSPRSIPVTTPACPHGFFNKVVCPTCRANA